jgi:hypothetical protein
VRAPNIVGVTPSLLEYRWGLNIHDGKTSGGRVDFTLAKNMGKVSPTPRVYDCFNGRGLSPALYALLGSLLITSDDSLSREVDTLSHYVIMKVILLAFQMQTKIKTVGAPETTQTSN